MDKYKDNFLYFCQSDPLQCEILFSSIFHFTTFPGAVFFFFLNKPEDLLCVAFSQRVQKNMPQSLELMTDIVFLDSVLVSLPDPGSDSC